MNGRDVRKPEKSLTWPSLKQLRARETRGTTFVEAATRARDSWKAKLIHRITEADDWRAAAWLLERQFPAEFGPKHEEAQRGRNGLLPPSAPGPIIHVTIQRDEASDAARKRFGTCPPNRTRYRSFPEDPVTSVST